MVCLLVREEALVDEGARGPGDRGDAASPLLLLIERGGVFFFFGWVVGWGLDNKRFRVPRRWIDPIDGPLKSAQRVSSSSCPSAEHSLLFSYHAVGPVTDRANLAVETRGRGDRGEEADAGDCCVDESDDAARRRSSSWTTRLSPPFSGSDRRHHGRTMEREGERESRRERVCALTIYG